MREVITEIKSWREVGKPVAIATNVKKEGSSLRPLGAKMAMTPEQEIAGSVTGGCVEGAVYEAGQDVIRSGQPKLLHFSAASEDSYWEVGLSCGGTLDVLIESLDSPSWLEIYPALVTSIEQNQLAAVATMISGPGLGKKLMLSSDGHTLGDLGDAGLNEQVREWMQSQMASQEIAWSAFSLAGESVDIFVDVFPPPARLIVIGAVHIAIPLVTLAKALGFYTIVIDPRQAFATRQRFPHVDELITEWPADALEKMHPDEDTFIAALSHDEKLDNSALAVALKSPARYVGVLGASKVIPWRISALREMGVTDEQLKRLKAPVGINLGAITPNEIALSILAEMVATRHENC